MITQAESDADNYIETALNNVNYLPITSGMQLYLETSKKSFKKKFDREMSPQEQLLYSKTFLNKIRTLKNNPNNPITGDRKLGKS